MPRSAKIDEDPTAGATVHPSVNGIDEKALTGYISEFEAEQAMIDEIMATAQAACQPHIDQQKEIKKAAAEAGIPKKPFSAKLRERSLYRRAERCRSVLSEEQQAIFDEISKKCGDMNLFQHALDA